MRGYRRANLCDGTFTPKNRLVYPPKARFLYHFIQLYTKHLDHVSSRTKTHLLLNIIAKLGELLEILAGIKTANAQFFVFFYETLRKKAVTCL